MDRIAAPILRNDRGVAVRNLQDGLLLVLAASASAAADPSRDALIERLRAERRDALYGDGTTEAVARFQHENRAAFSLSPKTGKQVDEPTAAAMNRVLQLLGVLADAEPDLFVITGRVEFEDGRPAARVRLDAFDRDLGRNRVLLGDRERPAITGEDGAFAPIHYRRRDFTGGEGRISPNANLVFEATEVEGSRSRPIASVYRRAEANGDVAETAVPDLVTGFEAARREHIRVVLAGRSSSGGASEFTRLIGDLKPLLLDGATPADLDQDRFRDVDFAARETGWDRAQVHTITVAWQLARAVSREPQQLAETFYGLLRRGAPTAVDPLPAVLSDLLNRHARWGRKLEDSLAHGIISGDLPLHLDRLGALRSDQAARTVDGRQGGVADVLSGLGVAEAERRALLSAYQAHDGPIEDFWRGAVPQRMGWTDAKVRDVQSALQLADMLAHDMPLIARLRANGIVTARNLAKLNRDELVELVTQVGPLSDAPGESVEERVARTVDGIIAVADATFPTDSVARIASNSRDPQLVSARDLLARFFEHETAAADGRQGFDILTSPVTTYLEEHGDRLFRETEPGDRALLTSQLRRLQRVFRLGADREQTEALLTLGLDSAFRVTRFSPQHFAAEFGEQLGGAGRASLVYERAEKIAGTVLYLYSDLWQGVQGVKPMSIMSSSQPEKIPALKELPTYRALFGNVQLCDCGHCQSFFSAAAYYVDMLHMLDRPSLGVNPVEVLLRRRPDLGQIQLTCENTNTLIPYVDLVTEVLESFVANRAPNPFNLPPGPPNRRLPAPSTEELRVNPVYLTAASAAFADQAYAALQEAVFPLTLPLNLPLETTRKYLEHLGVSRGELMRLFDRDPGFEAMMALAAELLLLSPEEFELITGAKFSGVTASRPASTAELFGLSTAGSPATLFNHAAPEFFGNPAAPDERAASIRSLQNVLSIIAPNPIPISGTFDAATEAAVNAILTSHGLPANGRTDDAFWGALEGDQKPSLSVLLCPVSMFLERGGLTYKELLALVKTRFVNPTLQGEGDADYLARLGVAGSEVRAWINAGLGAVPAPIQTALAAAGEDPADFKTWVTRRVHAIVINTAFESPCDVDGATLMHLDGSLLSPAELVTLFRFIRLWRKLGWSIEELDHVLDPGALESSAVFQTLLLLANVKQLHDGLEAPITDLVSLWQPIPTHGAPAAYDRLFRNRAAQLIDPVLALDRDRTELLAANSATPPALSDHVGAVLAALRLSAEDLDRVREAVGLADDPSLPPASRPRLNLSALSTIYRPVSLARALGLSVRELLVLAELSGLAVFERPDTFPRADALAFAELVNKERLSGVTVGALEYVCRGVAQPPALPGTQRGGWIRTIGAIVDGLHAIASEEPPRDDPDGEVLTARLTALIGPDDARSATALVLGRDVYRVSLTGLPAAFSFDPALNGRVAYDAAGKELRLRGAMTTADRALLLAALGVPAAVQAAYDRAIKALDAQARTFVARALGTLYSPGEAEAVLIDVPSLSPAGVPDLAAIVVKVADVLARRRSVLSRGLIKQTLTTATGLSADVVGLLLENEKVLKGIGGTGPAMDDYQAIGGDGLDAEYFANPDLTSPAALLRIDAAPRLDLQGAAPGPGVPAVGFSVRWTGNLYVPATGEVSFRTRCTDGIRLTVNGALVLDEWRDQSETEFTATLRLDGGQFYPVEVHYYNKTGSALLELSWASPSIPEAVLPQASLHSSTRFELLLQRVERIHKIALLLKPLQLNARDVQLLAEHGDMDLNLMPFGGPGALPGAQAMFRQWIALYDYAALRDRYPASDLSLMDVPSARTDAEARARFVTLTGAAAETLDAIIDVFTVRVFGPATMAWASVAPDLATLSWWGRIADALELVQRTGSTPEQLLAWSQSREITESPAGPETLWFTWTARSEGGAGRRADNARRAQEAKNVVRARYAEDRWRVEARALNDALRVRRRSALTAFVLAMPEMMRARIADTGRLFEFLLIDVEMDPCMETSRIKQGICSVQLFVQRVLLNLEWEVPPARVDGARWEWMKVFRVWEANRKVFLYAESYVDEGLRDDKTPEFTQLESEMLQDELTDANAERAIRHYIEKVDGISKLIVSGTCVDRAAGVLHVFGRTATVPFVFYHRRLDNKNGMSWTDGVWSPWLKLPVDVATTDDGDDSGAHLLPIVWNRRLYLFWPVFEEKADEVQNRTLPDGFDELKQSQIKLAWSEYKDGRWSNKQTGVPFLASTAFVKPITRDVTLPKAFFRPDRQTITVELKAEILGFEVASIKHTTTLIKADLITYVEDPMLSGTVLAADGDWASHEHREIGVTFLSLSAKPSDHYLDARVNGSELTIRVFCRHTGKPSGQFRSIKEDTLTVVRDGRRTDRKERSQIDGRTEGVTEEVFEQVGTFHFPACGTHLDGDDTTQPLNFNSLERPQDTTNKFMALRAESPSVKSLRLTNGADPILKSVLNPFEVIDSDNLSGFDRSAPFFYQDQRRCYLVTRDRRARMFDSAAVLRVQPDPRAAVVESAIGIKALDDRHAGLAADASLRVNPWALTALQRWSDGPGLPAALRSDARATTQALSGTFSAKPGFIKDAISEEVGSYVQKGHPEYTFITHWHPYTCPFIAALNSGGLPALYTLENQSRTDGQIVFGGVIGGPMPVWFTSNFTTVYKPDAAQVAQPYPLEEVDFSRTGAFSKYNWEIFFHMPMSEGVAHSRAGRYREAMRCYHRIYDPTTTDGDDSDRRVWRFLPFRTADTARIEETVALLSYTGPDPVKLKQRSALESSIQEWLDNPFNPHLIARQRPVVYMKYVFMKYLDNLIAWGDELFQRDTIESINEATQLYVLVANLLGPRRPLVPAPGSVAPETFQTLRSRLDALSNAQVDLETRLPFTQLFGGGTGTAGQLTHLPQTLYFCLPQNDKMLAYWDTIADRLFKIRHCMSFDGTVRQLPLFEPPIDPMLLVQAVAHGLDIGSVLNDLYAPLPRYRFSFMLQQALALCLEVRALGNLLLSVIEKHNAEELLRLRTGHERQLLEHVKANKKRHIDEAEQTRQALEQAGRMVSARIDYYDSLLTEGLNPEEMDQLGSLDASKMQQETASWIEASAQMLNLIPNISVSKTGTSVSFGGSNLGSAASAVGKSSSSKAASNAQMANRSSITGAHARRAQEWRFQRDLAKRELVQVEKQGVAATIRRDIAKAELRNHETQIEHSRSIEEHLRTKFTNEGLWEWMEGQLRTVYFQCFKSAYEMSKSAERSWRYAVGADATFITFGAWDSSVRGLLAGERLHMQLKQMERAYLDQQVREFEIAKDVSIAQLDPLALIALKETGKCEVEVPEWLFDIDYAGHYFRRLKTVAVSIPAVVGRPTSLNATLTLLASKVRESSRIVGTYDDDENHRPDHLAVEAIAVSTAQSDSGRFQLDFRDEKYLPFEGAGAISRWRIELPRKLRSFDYDTMSDVVLHFKYTSRRDESLIEPALAAVQDKLDAAGTGTLFHLFSLRHDFPNEWQTLRASSTRSAMLTIAKDRFPLLVQAGALTVAEVHTSLILKQAHPGVSIKATLTPGARPPIDLAWPGALGRYRNDSKPVSIPISALPADNGWQLQFVAPTVTADLDKVRDILIAIRYSVKM